MGLTYSEYRRNLYHEAMAEAFPSVEKKAFITASEELKEMKVFYYILLYIALTILVSSGDILMTINFMKYPLLIFLWVLKGVLIL
jgi:hypothetical protein